MLADISHAYLSFNLPTPPPPAAHQKMCEIALCACVPGGNILSFYVCVCAKAIILTNILIKLDNVEMRNDEA